MSAKLKLDDDNTEQTYWVPNNGYVVLRIDKKIIKTYNDKKLKDEDAHNECY